MIKSHMGNVKVEGKRSIILTDLAVAVQAIMEAFVENGSNGESAKEEIMHHLIMKKALWRRKFGNW